MNFFITLITQLIGLFNLAIPAMVAYILAPAFVASTIGKIFFSSLIGLSVWYAMYSNTKKQTRILQFIPSGIYKQNFDGLIKACAIEPDTIHLRYGYTNEMLAMAMFNTVIIDPLLWSGVEEDPEFIKVNKVLTDHVLPTLSELQKTRLAKVKPLFSPAVQNFIFRHELAHVYNNFSIKKLLIVGLCGALTGYTGMSLALAFKHLGFNAILMSVCAAWLVDLLLTFGSNIFFKSFAEKNADIFAAQYSTCEEIEAAAEFFEQLQIIYDIHKDSSALASYLPSIIISGHLNGKSRGRYLRAIARQKTC